MRWSTRRTLARRIYSSLTSSPCNTTKAGPVLAGQPLPSSHPHLLGPKDLTLGIEAAEYAERRRQLLEHLEPSSAAVILGYETRYATNNIFYPFQQATDFFYLTGFDEPEAAAVLEKLSDKKEKYTLFVRPTDAHSALWEGSRAGLEGARTHFHADNAKTQKEFTGYYDATLSRVKQLLVDRPKDINLFASQHILRPGESQLRPLSPIVQKMRWIKSAAEIRIMHQAGQISGEALIEVMRHTRPGMSEDLLASRMEWECRKRGAKGLSYVPVVAGGRNALTMHYVQNQQCLRDGDLVLMDAGCSYGGYCSDITRTWPVNGTFTSPQRDLYEAVLAVQKRCIKMCTEEQAISLDEIHNASVKATVQELANLGWTTNRSVSVERRLYPHHVGHFLGLDVHDTPNIGRHLPLKAGCVVTIEPGLYVPDEPQFPKAFRGIGIRIEDDVVVGPTKPFILSAWAPKEVADLEALCAKGGSGDV
ncbi:peptidase M24, structural domain-containing protein [Piptocephalis cylindrospora]|uniref:Peptidase M24, structural domain-containing protein n=1 Tax=Piptocephalis cylindrospora TaxID=1907219 RepID=A0A4P9Y632_9FUNG|nr:peptidase M24, structural domain-containing protein [Piptocephalis cylindrospora]|eukprot:RKP14526.1 peptidase M24, structural domain-containing protein [Piptocephalis cylindrospora]